MTLDVHIGRDGWLFLSGGSNELLKFYGEPGFFDSAKQHWLLRLRDRIQMSRLLGATYRHMTIPDKLSIYPEHYRDQLAMPDAAPTRALPRFLAQQPDGPELSACIVDVYDRMLKGKASGALLHWKTDSHWTFEGCYLAYLALCESIGARPHPAIPDAPVGSAMLTLDLGAKLVPPVQEEYFVKYFLRDGKRFFANDIVQYKERENALDAPGLHVGSAVAFRNEVSATDPRTIVLFGDSYSEYRTHQLTGLLAETFAETHFIWSSNIDWEYVRSVKADIVVTEMAERFMNLVPNDQFSIGSFSRDRLRDFLATQQPKS